MDSTISWADSYIEKRCSAEEAIARVRSGQRIFLGSACGEPQILVKTLADNFSSFSGLEIVRMMSAESAPITEIANKTHDSSINIRNFYLGSASVDTIARNKRFVTPLNMSDVPMLFQSRKMVIHVAMIQVSPPDDFGWMSLGVSVDVTLAAARSAGFVIAQVNSKMPKVMGHSFIHVNDVDCIVEHDENLLTIDSVEQSEVAVQIGNHISRLIEDGSTLQVGLDAASQATVQALSDKNDLGVHSQYLTVDLMHLYGKEIINNKKKGLNDGKLVASAAVGTSELYEFLHDNPGIEFFPSDYVNDPFIIAQHRKMVSMNVARTIDLMGQVTVEAAAQTLYAGVSGIPDFVRGARRSKGGKSIIFLPSTTPDGKKSSIIPMTIDEAVVVPRSDVHWVATEYGVANLFGKSIQERVMAMISIAHPSFRDELLDAAKNKGMIGKERTLGEAVRGIYPVGMEDTFIRGDKKVFLRPAKPSDERRIQEHYYSLDKGDVYSRFFQDKKVFNRSDLQVMSHIDYIKDLTLIGVVGEVGFENVIAVGEYLLIVESNMAEVAFSISKEYQGVGIGRVILHKLAQAARNNGISGLVAHTIPGNKAMINLFKSLPYHVQTKFEEDALILSCKFSQLKEGLG